MRKRRAHPTKMRAITVPILKAKVTRFVKMDHKMGIGLPPFLFLF